MATTISGTEKSAKRNILSQAAVRYVGLITAFCGLVFLILKQPLETILADIATISSIAFILVGLLLFVCNIKNVFLKRNDKNTGYYILLGVLFIAVAILLLIFKQQACKWICIIFASLLAIYGILRLIKYLTSKRKGVLYVIDIVLSLLLISVGVMIVLMGFIKTSSVYLLILGINATILGVSDIVLH